MLRVPIVILTRTVSQASLYYICFLCFFYCHDRCNTAPFPDEKKACRPRTPQRHLSPRNHHEKHSAFCCFGLSYSTAPLRLTGCHRSTHATGLTDDLYNNVFGKEKRMDPEKRKKLDAKLRAMLESSEQPEKKQKIVTVGSISGGVGVIRRRKGSPEKRF